MLECGVMKTSKRVFALVMMSVSAMWAGEMEDLLAKAGEGDAVAQYEVGRKYSTGEGVSRNMEEAVKWLLESGVQGNVDAALSLGSIYVGGRGVPKSSTEAAKWYLMAATQGRAAAQLQMARMHLAGAGVVKDDVEAYKWATLAHEQGEGQANQILTFLRERMSGVEVARGQAQVREFKMRKEAAAAEEGVLPVAPPLDDHVVEPEVEPSAE